MTHSAHVSGTPGGGHGHAVVIGSSLAGLTAARALANFMDHVTVIDRDWMPHGPARRRGVPQARHTHTLTHTAQQGLQQLFPHITADLEAAGAVRVHPGEDLLVLGPAGWLPRTATGQGHLSASRDLIDAVLRERLRAEPKVTFLPRHEAVGLEGGPHDTVTGVWIRPLTHPHTTATAPERRLISADFVIDASGRDSHAPQWLADLGYRTPKETVTETHASFATAVFAPPVGHVADFTALLLTPAPGHPAQGTLSPIEGGRWSVTVTTADHRPAPADHAALLRAAGTLRHPLLRDLIAAATPLGPVYRATATASRWRHYEKLRRFPDQFLVVGDAYAALHPVHGQGMTRAISDALVLDQLLTAHDTAIGLGYRLRRALARQLTPAWRATTRAQHAAQDPTTPTTATTTSAPTTSTAATEATASTTSPTPTATTAAPTAPPAPEATAPPQTAAPRPTLRARLAARLSRRLAARLAAAATTDARAAALLLQQLQPADAPAARPRLWRAALRGARAAAYPAPTAPPSTTHGPHTRRRRTPAPDTPAARALTGAARQRTTPAARPQGPHTSPAGDRRRP
ncbi:FAD-dependent oxidoreductase [Streptomyces flavalbus]|uniref:FAD-dependent oxidoreductase n=1 Tax=Streptomyces flavalbus TaxID=2665155 RepID=A0ABW2WM59_9ACTN